MDRLVEALERERVLPAEWAATVAAVDRGLFIPAACPDIDRARDEEAWLRTVYGDLPVITQLDDGAAGGRGAPTSSSSQPSLMLQMLGLLGVREGHRVLEIGTATGYHAAWLCHRLGDDAVTTIEIDETLCAQARRNLRSAGFAPHVVCGEGLKGWAANAPYDRVISTCTLREIPAALLAGRNSRRHTPAPFRASAIPSLIKTPSAPPPVTHP